MKSEADFTRWFCNELEKCNCKVTAIVASQMQEPGIPDRHVMHKYLPQGQVWLEFKKDHGSLRAAQKSWLLKAFEHGTHCLVVRWVVPRTVVFENVSGTPLSVVTLPQNGVGLRKAIIDALSVTFDDGN